MVVKAPQRRVDQQKSNYLLPDNQLIITMEDIGDVSMVNGLGEISHLPISEDEEKILALYDRLQELRLEIAIINAQKTYQSGLFSLIAISLHVLTIIR